MNDSTTKQCSRCKVILLADTDHFSKNKRGKNGLDSWCKACRREHALQGYWKNHDKRLAQMKQYYQANKHWLLPVIKRRVDEWRKTNRQKFIEYKKKNYLVNRDRILADAREFRKANPDKLKQTNRVTNHARRVRVIKAEGSFDKSDIDTLHKTQKGLCWWCGKKLNSKYHIDHRVALSRGGTNWPNNLCLSCEHCNLSKGAKLPSEWNGRLL